MRLNKNIKIITDIEIKQSPIWINNTVYMGDLLAELNGFSKPTFLKTIIKPKSWAYFINVLKKVLDFDVIITANIHAAQMIGFLRKMFSIKAPKHIVLELMLDESSSSFKWNVKRIFQRFIFSSVNKIIVSSSDEVIAYSQRFNLPKNKFKFILFHTNVIEPMLIQSPKNYILSAGRTGRDFQTLIEAAKTLPMQCVVIADQESVQGIDIPENVDLLTDIPRDHYIKILKECYFVVVPLHNLIKSTGQVVILEAMALGKPVIATDVVGTRDYIDPGVTGFLVPPYDPKALQKTIDRLVNDDFLHKKLSRNAMEFVLKNATFDLYVKNILKVAGLVVSND